MKNTIKNNLAAAAAAKKAAQEAAKAAAVEADEKAKIEEFASKHANVDIATIKDIVCAAKKGELFFIAMGQEGLVADYATSKDDAKKHIEWIYRSARESKEELLLGSSSIMRGMAEMQRKFQIAHDAIEAGLIPEDAIIDENNVEHWVVGNKAYSTDGVVEADLDDIETKLSLKDRKTLLKERIEKLQKELEETQREEERLIDEEQDEWLYDDCLF